MDMRGLIALISVKEEPPSHDDEYRRHSETATQIGQHFTRGNQGGKDFFSPSSMPLEVLGVHYFISFLNGVQVTDYQGEVCGRPLRELR